MGYYTRFTLTMEVHDPGEYTTCSHETIEGAAYCHVCGTPTQHTDKTLRKRLIDDVAPVVDEYLPNALKSMYEGEQLKWYAWDNDMKQVSELMPGVLFTLKGEGEENEDIWVAYFLDGKMQQSEAQIIVDGFRADSLR